MEEAEVEVLNENDIEIGKLAELKTVEKQVATMVFNGQPINTQTIKQCVLVCPTCGHVLMEFNSGYEEVIILKALTDEQAQKELYKTHAYCPHCGQKLSYDREVVADVPSEA